MKALSVAFTISVVDIFAKAKMVSALNGRYMLTFLIVALIYWGICVIFTNIFSFMEKSCKLKIDSLKAISE